MSQSTKIARIHKDNLNGTCNQCNIGITSEGQIVNMQIKNRYPIAKSKALACGCPVLTIEQITNLLQNKNNSQMTNSSNQVPFGIVGVETATGGRNVARMEMAANNSNRKPFNFSITNTDAVDHELVLGDAAGLISAKLGLPTLSPKVTVNGTYGTTAFAVLKTLTTSIPLDLHSMNVSSQAVTALDNGNPALPNPVTAAVNSEAFYAQGGLIAEAKADVGNQSLKDDEVPLAADVTDKSFQTHIRNNVNWRFQVNALTGIHIKIPAKTRLNFYSFIEAAGVAFGMVKTANLR